MAIKNQQVIEKLKLLKETLDAIWGEEWMFEPREQSEEFQRHYRIADNAVQKMREIATKEVEQSHGETDT